MDKRQFEMLDKFFAQQDKWAPDQYIYKFLGYLFFGFTVMFSAFPIYSSSNEERFDQTMIFLVIIFYLWGLETVMKKYTTYTSDKQLHKIWDLIQYLPVSRKQYFLYKMRQLIKSMIKPALWMICVQLLFTVKFEPEYLLLNGLCIVALAIGLPLVVYGSLYAILK